MVIPPAERASLAGMKRQASLEAIEKVRVGTPHRSVYAFFGDGFHRATHERVKGSAKQREDVYSFTFRCGESELE